MHGHVFGYNIGNFCLIETGDNVLSFRPLRNAYQQDWSPRFRQPDPSRIPRHFRIFSGKRVAFSAPSTYRRIPPILVFLVVKTLTPRDDRFIALDTFFMNETSDPSSVGPSMVTAPDFGALRRNMVILSATVDTTLAGGGGFLLLFLQRLPFTWLQVGCCCCCGCCCGCSCCWR